MDSTLIWREIRIVVADRSILVILNLLYTQLPLFVPEG